MDASAQPFPLPSRLRDDAWWLAERRAPRPARVIPFPGSRKARGEASDPPKQDRTR